MTYLELFNIAVRQFLNQEITEEEFIRVVKLVSKKFNEETK